MISRTVKVESNLRLPAFSIVGVPPLSDLIPRRDGCIMRVSISARFSLRLHEAVRDPYTDQKHTYQDQRGDQPPEVMMSGGYGMPMDIPRHLEIMRMT
jgi:hypothetical protein